MDTLKKLMKIDIWCQFLLMKAKKKQKNMKNCGVVLISAITKNSDDSDEKFGWRVTSE